MLYKTFSSFLKLAVLENKCFEWGIECPKPWGPSQSRRGRNYNVLEHFFTVTYNDQLWILWVTALQILSHPTCTRKEPGLYTKPHIMTVASLLGFIALHSPHMGLAVIWDCCMGRDGRSALSICSTVIQIEIGPLLAAICPGMEMSASTSGNFLITANSSQEKGGISNPD